MAKFKKPTVKSRGILRKRELHNDDEGEEEATTLSKIQSTQKRQKLLQSTLYKRGLDANGTFRVEVKRPKEEDKAKNTSGEDARDAVFKTTFSSTNAEEGQSESAMQKKHQSAMEEFIARKMDTSSAKEHDQSSSFTADPRDQGEADMGAGGTMLGGTGIAEVILPVEQRLESAKRTEQLRAGLPASFGKHASSAGSQVQHRDVEGLASFNIFKGDRQPAAAHPPVSALHREGMGDSDLKSSNLADHNRLGFQAARHGQEPVTRNKFGSGGRANDERVLKQFMRKELSKR